MKGKQMNRRSGMDCEAVTKECLKHLNESWWGKYLKDNGITIVDTVEESVVGDNPFMCLAVRMDPEGVVNVPVER